MRSINCDNCGSGYEIERILIGPEGTPVKCANCGQVFTVFPEDEAKLQSPVVWILKDAEGNNKAFNKLGVLQKMILNGQANGDFELSRFGERWKRLDEIEGLKIFFERRS